MRRWEIKKIIISLTIIAGLAVIFWLGLSWPARGLVFWLVDPLASKIYSTYSSLKTSLAAWTDPAELSKENQELRSSLSQLRLENSDLLRQAAEVEQLKEILDYQEQSIYQTTPARVSGRTKLGGQQILTLNKGRQAGVEVGDLVTDALGNLIGEVMKANQLVSQVRLLTHPDLSLAVQLPGDQQPLGILRGEFSTGLSVELIPAEIRVTPGQALVTANLDSRPGQLLVGEISSVNTVPGGLYQSAIVGVYYNIDKVTFVQIFTTPEYE